jgi:DNA-binding response OmpR family regulator
VEQLVEEIGRVPVLFVSGYTRGALLSRFSFPPDSDFLGKPFTSDEVLERLDALLSTRSRR